MTTQGQQRLLNDVLETCMAERTLALQAALAETETRRRHDRVEGSGIGLYMVKKIAENAGGTVAVHSQSGVGTTFVVSLPG